MLTIPKSVLRKRNSRFKIVKYNEYSFEKIYALPLYQSFQPGLAEYYKDLECTILHNLDGPAIWESWKKQYYFIDGVRLTYRKWIASSNALKEQARKVINDKQSVKDKIVSDNLTNKTAKFYQSFLNQLSKKKKKK